MKQCEKILYAMLKHPEITWWYAKDFQSGNYFVGYEATARMSDLIRMYPEVLIAEKDGRYRTLRVNWKNKKAIKKILKEKEW